jgi:hypothetical protein
MATLQRPPLITLGWQSWTFILVVLTLLLVMLLTVH